MNIFKLSKEHIEECADLFIEVFTKAPWNDTYDSRTQVIDFFQNHMDNDYFVGYGLESQNRMIAASIGMKKPWINGMEYYIDQFYVKTDWQGKGTGSLFLKLIESEIRTEKMNAIILNTAKGFPAENFLPEKRFQIERRAYNSVVFHLLRSGKKEMSNPTLKIDLLAL